MEEVDDAEAGVEPGEEAVAVPEAPTTKLYPPTETVYGAEVDAGDEVGAGEGLGAGEPSAARVAATDGGSVAADGTLELRVEGEPRDVG